MLDIIQILFFLATCAMCYFAGTINGASGFARLLIEYNIVTKEQMEKFTDRLQNEK